VHEAIRPTARSDSVKKMNLQDFVASATIRNRITFGDVRRLQRDYLPHGVATREDAELLIGLDAKVGRADRAWVDWLAAAITDFALAGGGPADATDSEPGDWLKQLFAASGASTKATRRIARTVRREAKRAHPTSALRPEEPGAQACGGLADASSAAGLGGEGKPKAERKPRRTSARRPKAARKRKENARLAPPRLSRPIELPSLPAPVIWSSAIIGQHSCFPLAGPYA
jgi:hypothetical protein